MNNLNKAYNIINHYIFNNVIYEKSFNVTSLMWEINHLYNTNINFKDMKKVLLTENTFKYIPFYEIQDDVSVTNSIVYEMIDKDSDDMFYGFIGDSVIDNKLKQDDIMKNVMFFLIFYYNQFSFDTLINAFAYYFMISYDQAEFLYYFVKDQYDIIYTLPFIFIYKEIFNILLFMQNGLSKNPYKGDFV